LMAVPTVQEQVKVFAERVEMDFQEQMKLVTQNMEMPQAGEQNFQEQAKRVEEQMKAILTKSVTKQMEALPADPSFHEQAKMFAARMQNSQDKMVDKMLDRRLKTSSLEHANLENAMLGKPSSPAVQPRMGMKSSMVLPSIGASSTRSAIRSSALQDGKSKIVRASSFSGLFGRKTVQDKVAKPNRGFSRNRRSMPEPEEEDEFISEEVEEYIKEAAFLFMRLAAASVMIHHGQEKILSAEAFTRFAIDKYFAFLPAIGGKRVVWAYFSGGVQAVGPILLSLGVFSRLAAVSLAGTMVGASYYSFVTTGLEGFPLSKMAAKVPVFHNYGFETPVLYLAIFALVAAAGPGKLSVAQALGWNDDKSLFGKIKQ